MIRRQNLVGDPLQVLNAGLDLVDLTVELLLSQPNQEPKLRQVLEGQP